MADLIRLVFPSNLRLAEVAQLKIVKAGSPLLKELGDEVTHCEELRFIDEVDHESSKEAVVEHYVGQCQTHVPVASPTSHQDERAQYKAEAAWKRMVPGMDPAKYALILLAIAVEEIHEKDSHHEHPVVLGILLPDCPSSPCPYPCSLVTTSLKRVSVGGYECHHWP